MMKHRITVLGLLVVVSAFAIAVPAYAFLHDSQYNSYTTLHGLNRAGSKADGFVQVITNNQTGYCNGNVCTGVAFRISLFSSNTRIYDYTCHDAGSCYHNHQGTVAECHTRAANQASIFGTETMSYHLNQDDDYCG